MSFLSIVVCCCFGRVRRVQRRSLSWWRDRVIRLRQMQNELTVPQLSRPPSSLASRPTSRASQHRATRPRPSTRHNHLIHELVVQISNTPKGDIKHSQYVEAAMRSLDSGKHTAPMQDIQTVDKRIKGLVCG